uniref:Uncharacterized protein n=1 Tax=Mycena chlorophos TaxID=658473 RepID=A0ABQ0LNH3_MYCCL|nr:predicted protein [Mycena chlorophos]
MPSGSTSVSVDIATSTLVALFVECIIYGMFILLFALAMSVLLGKRKRRTSGTRPLVGVSITMFILATIHVGIDLRRAMDQFLFDIDISPVASVNYLLKSTAYAMQTIVGDGFMIYRVYLVWNGDKRIVFPLIVCLMGGIGVGAGALHSFAATKGDNAENPLFLTALHNWIVSFFSMTLFTNATCTLLIAGRIYMIERATRHTTKVFGNRLGPAIMIIVESGSIYSVALVLLLALYVNNSYAQYIVLDAEVQIVGVVFTMIIVRVGMGLSSDMTTYAASQSQFRGHGTGKSGASGGRSVPATLELTARGPGVHVETSREVKSDVEQDGEGVYATKAGSMWVGDSEV